MEIEASEKNYILGSKIGFVEPERGKFQLLGKIAEQYPISSEDPTLPTQIDYKLYQIDSNRFASSTAVSNIIENKKTIEQIKKEMDILRNSAHEPIKHPNMEKQRLAQQEKERQAELERLEMQERQQREWEKEQEWLEQQELDRIRREQQEHPIQKLMRIPKRERISPPSVSFKRSGNLEFMIPDVESNVKYHVSKESFFW
jgi:hypothetical protein